MPGPTVASGKLDTSYGNGGSVLLGNLEWGFFDMTVAGDGTAILAGRSTGKLDPAGTKVPSYGQALSPRSLSDPVLGTGAAVYGKLFDPASGMWSLAKLDANGRLDATFGSGGLVSIGLFSGQLLRDGAGSLYLATTFPQGGIESLWVAKYDADGRQVAAYGANGFARVDAGGARTLFGSAAVDDSGNVYVAGVASTNMVVAKLDAGGHQAADFAASGLWIQACGERAEATAVAVDASRNVYVGGTCARSDGTAAPALFKLDSRGSVVASFRDGGLRNGLFGPATTLLDRVKPVLVPAGGAIYVGGETGQPGCRNFTVAKLDAQGNSVPGFGDNGIATFDNMDDVLSDLALDSRGLLYLGGTVSTCGLAGKSVTGFAVYRVGG